jgi:hypothetical protein
MIHKRVDKSCPKELKEEAGALVTDQGYSLSSAGKLIKVRHPF